MRSALSVKMPKWLKWPSDRQVAFLLAVTLVTIAVDSVGRWRLGRFLETHIAFDLFTTDNIGTSFSILTDFLAYYLLVSFVGLFLLGLYDKLWLAPFAAFIWNLLALLVDYVFDLKDFYPFDPGGFLLLVWLLFILFLWFVPRSISNKAASLLANDPAAELPRPGFKLSSLFIVFWVLLLGVVLLLEFSWLGTELNEISQSFSDGDFFPYRTAFDIYFLLYEGIWGPLAVFFLIDLFRKDARFFYLSVGLFTALQVVNLWVGLSVFSYTEGNSDELYLVLLLLGGSLLLRAAWNRPSPEAEIALE